MENLTVVYYTCNYLDDKNPYFLNNTRKQLEASIEDLPLVVVSQKPVQWPRMTENVMLGDIGRSHFNIYKQILEGCKAANTEWVALAEDDILYSNSHFHPEFFIDEKLLAKDMFFYDMNKMSIFTWSNPPIFSFRPKRKVVNQLICRRQLLIDAMEERFALLPKLREQGWPEERILRYWGDPGRYEKNLGVSVHECYEWYCWLPSIVFSHELAYGYEFNQGKRKKDGNIRIVELAEWGRAEDILKLWKPSQP